MFNAIILAADKKDGIKSAKPVFLHEISFQPLIKWVIDAVNVSNQVVVTDFFGNDIHEALGNAVQVIEQNSKINTLYGIANSKEHFGQFDGDILVITADMPLITTETIFEAYDFHKKNQNTATTFKFDEISSSICFFNSKKLYDVLEELSYESSNTEIQLADIIKAFCSKMFKTESFIVKDADELSTIKNRIELAKAQHIVQKRINNKHLLNGVTFISPETSYIGNDVEIGIDTIIMPNTIIKGNTSIGPNCVLGPNTQITDCKISDNVEINSSVLYESTVDCNTKIGPFAYIRPHSKIGKNIKIGDFVEIKNATIDDGTKVSHLTYVGDADVGKNVNFGCGTITVNYDGANKHRSTIENNAFIGCNTNLVSPVTIKENAFIAAGSTITDDVPENSLAIARARQVVKTDWKRKTKN